MTTTNTMQNRNERSLFSAAIDVFFEKVLEDGGPLGVMSHQPEALAPDASIWAYAVMARYHNMDESERAKNWSTMRKSTRSLTGTITFMISRFPGQRWARPSQKGLRLLLDHVAEEQGRRILDER